MRWRWHVLFPALPLLVLCLAGTRGAGENQAVVPSTWGYVLAAVAALSLLLRRRAPLVGLTAAALATGAYLLLDQPYGPILFVLPVWAWCLAAVMPLRRAVPWLAGYLAVAVASAASRSGHEQGWTGLLVWATGMAGAAAAGAGTGFALAARRRSEAAARTEIARRAVSEERLAMAQDVHDGVGHTLAVIAMHAGVAAHVIDRDPGRAKELLGVMAETCREALEDLRADLDRLRGPDGAARSPGPGLADLPLLLDRMRDGGLRLEVELPSPLPEAVPADVGAAAYRIVQESLTNVLRHAGTADASVRVRLDGVLLVEVADRGPARSGPADPAWSGPAERAWSGPAERARSGPAERAWSGPADPARSGPADPARSGPAERAWSGPADPARSGPADTSVGRSGATGGSVWRSGAADPGLDRSGPGDRGLGGERPAGTGIAGMRRRAEAVGGSLAAGPRPGGGFLVRAELPGGVPSPRPLTAPGVPR